MMPRHSFNISLAKFSSVYKMMLYIAVLVLILSSLAIGILYPVISPLVRELTDLHIFKAIGDAFGSLFDGDIDVQHGMFAALKDAWHGMLEIFGNATRELWIAITVIVIIYFIYKFFVNMLTYTTEDVTNHFMSTGSRYGFLSNLVANLRRSWSYSLIAACIDLATLVVNSAIIYFVGWLFIKVSLLLMLPVAMLVIILLLSIKNAAFSAWLPNMIVAEKSSVDALKIGLKSVFSKGNFLPVIGAYIMYWFLAIAITIVLALPSFGLSVFVIPVFAILFSRTYNLVVYYNRNNLKYYIDKHTVIDNDVKIDTLQ